MTLGDEGLLRDVVSSVVAEAGYDLEETTVTAAGRRRLVRVAIDRDGGVDLDAAAAVSRRIAARLDEHGEEILEGAPYTLEVTSPGTGRPLTEPRHFRRAAGRLVALTLTEGRTLSGRILSLDGDTLTMLTGAHGVQRREVALADVVRGRVEVEFSPPPAAVAELLAERRGRRNASSTSGPTSSGQHPAQEGKDAR